MLEPAHTAEYNREKSVRVRDTMSYLRQGGALLVLGSLAFFLLMQSHSLWESPSLMTDRWKALYQPLRLLFPNEWIMARKASPLGLMNNALFLLLIALLFAVYLWVVRLLFFSAVCDETQGKRAFSLVLIVTASVLTIFLFSPGFLSTDLYSYISYGRITAIYTDNPYFSVPANYAWYDESSWLQWVVWKQTPSAYGPVWVGLATLLALAAQAIDGDIVTHLLAHKLLADVAHIVNVFILWQVSRIVIQRYWQPPPDRSGGDIENWRSAMRVGVTATYAWNPMVLIEFGISGHNDVLMITGILAALWLHLSGRWRRAVSALAIASLIKVSALFFLPGYFWLLAWENHSTRQSRNISRSTSKLAQAVALFAATWMVAYLPYWQGLQTLKHLSGGPAATQFIHSLGAIIRYKLADGIALLVGAQSAQSGHFWTAEEIGRRIEFPTRWGLLLISVVVAAFSTWKARSFPLMVYAWGWGLLAYLTIGSVWFWPWYVTWLLVPIALVGPGRLFTAVQVLCMSSMTVYVLSPQVAKPFEALVGWTGAFVALPPLVYLGIAQWQAMSRSASSGRFGVATPVGTDRVPSRGAVMRAKGGTAHEQAAD